MDQSDVLDAERICRQVRTERDWFDAHGIFYGLPAKNTLGFAKKRIQLSHNASHPVNLRVEVEPTAAAHWILYRVFKVDEGIPTEHRLPDAFSAARVRVRTDKDTTAHRVWKSRERPWQGESSGSMKVPRHPEKLRKGGSKQHRVRGQQRNHQRLKTPPTLIVGRKSLLQRFCIPDRFVSAEKIAESVPHKNLLGTL
ncbi:MAG: hypothetical protein RLZZ399_1515 [Verrucomicrobiota bacterium]